MHLVHHLVGAREIALMLGLSRQRVDQLANEPGFPEPEARLEMGRVWSRAGVIDWAKASGRPCREDASNDEPMDDD